MVMKMTNEITGCKCARVKFNNTQKNETSRGQSRPWPHLPLLFLFDLTALGGEPLDETVRFKAVRLLRIRERGSAVS